MNARRVVVLVAAAAGAALGSLVGSWLLRIRAAEQRAVRPFAAGGGPASGLRADAIAVLGATVHEWGPSGELRARLDHAAALWRAGAAPVVVVSGGVDRGIDEIDSMTDYLEHHGVPRERIRPGRPGDNTQATVTALRRLRLGRYVAVSSPYHACRIEREAARQGVAVVVSAPASTPEMARPRARATQRFAELLANVWYAAPAAVTARVGVPRLRHTLPRLLSGYSPPPRSQHPPVDRGEGGARSAPPDARVPRQRAGIGRRLEARARR